MQYIHSTILMNVWYICSSEVLIIVSPGLSLKFTEMRCLHPLCAMIFRPVTRKKLFSRILPADSEHAQNHPIYSSLKRTGWPVMSAFLPNFSTVSFQNSQNNQFPKIFCYGTAFINCNVTPCWTNPLTEDCPLVDIKKYLRQQSFGTGH